MGKKKTRDALTYETLPELFTGICDAIRAKTGGSDPIAHQSIPSQIASINTGGDYEIAFNSRDQIVAYTEFNLSHTVENTGTLRMVLHFGTSANSCHIYKNDVDIKSTANSVFSDNTGRNTCYSFNALSVTAGDVIRLNVGQQGLTEYCYFVGIITPTT